MARRQLSVRKILRSQLRPEAEVGAEDAEEDPQPAKFLPLRLNHQPNLQFDQGAAEAVEVPRTWYQKASVLDPAKALKLWKKNLLKKRKRNSPTQM